MYDGDCTWVVFVSVYNRVPFLHNYSTFNWIESDIALIGHLSIGRTIESRERRVKYGIDPVY